MGSKLHLLFPTDSAERNRIDELVKRVAQCCKTSEQSHAFGSNGKWHDLHCVCDWKRGECNVIKSEITVYNFCQSKKVISHANKN